MAGAGKVLAKEIAGQKFSKALGRGLGKLAEKAGAKGRAVQKTAQKKASGQDPMLQKSHNQNSQRNDQKPDFKRKINPDNPPAERTQAPKGLGGQGGLHDERYIVKPEEHEQIAQYFQEYKNQKFLVGTYKDLKKIGETRNEKFQHLKEGINGKAEFTVRHHVGTQANNRHFIAHDIHPDAGVSILIPKIWHESFVHTANKYKFNNLREALFWSIRDLRNCALRISDPILQNEVRQDLNTALLEVIRLNKVHFSEYLQKNLTK
ncbi:hypothetical protein P618_200709 [Holospora obtusa F1]|uniref:Uncharacterized protein n=1 Tax=Holospora obtusa F1 TaxID=1399147 RepID=W6TDI4_HOLOB|nr:hypothetical protein P618_200709 [Holospora obtusa F1]